MRPHASAISPSSIRPVPNATGIKLENAPFCRLDNLYIGNFTGSGTIGQNGVGIEQGLNCWQCCFSNVKIQGLHDLSLCARCR